MPFYSGIATGAASLVVLCAIATVALITWYGKWGYLWREWLTSVDHKRIGIMYIAISLVMLSRAVIEAAMMRLQQAVSFNVPGYLPPEHFAQLFSTHGTIMIFFMAMPFLTGLINYAVPLQIGARDVSFPVMNSISLGLTAGGAGLMMISLVLGKFSTGGWSGYPPYTELAFNPGVGPDYWIWALTLSSIASTMTGINFAVTIYKRRTKGMTLFRMPLFTWTALTTSILMIFAMPPLTVATALLAADRYLGMHFFTNALGGNMMNFANLFWLFGHPEVYILILPAFGVYSEVIANFSSKALYGYRSLVYATMAIGVVSFAVWLHHFFTMGQSANINAVFGIATMVVGIPTGVKIYDWILTMFRGRVRFAVPMLYALAFLVLFPIGGLTGILLANPAIDYQVHNTLFLVAHFHNMLIPGLLVRHDRRLSLLVSESVRLPARRDLGPHRLRAVGHRLPARLHAALRARAAGHAASHSGIFQSGLSALHHRRGVRRRAHPVRAGSLFVQLWVSIRRREQTRVFAGDPWNGRTLEWSRPGPPPEYNFPVAAGRARARSVLRQQVPRRRLPAAGGIRGHRDAAQQRARAGSRRRRRGGRLRSGLAHLVDGGRRRAGDVGRGHRPQLRARHHPRDLRRRGEARPKSAGCDGRRRRARACRATTRSRRPTRDWRR